MDVNVLPPRILTLAPLFSRIPLIVVPLAPRTGPTCRGRGAGGGGGPLMVVPLAPRTGPTLKGRVQAGGRRFSGGQQHRAAVLAKPHLQVGGQSTGRGEEIQREIATQGGSIGKAPFCVVARGMQRAGEISGTDSPCWGAHRCGTRSYPCWPPLRTPGAAPE